MKKLLLLLSALFALSNTAFSQSSHVKNATAKPSTLVKLGDVIMVNGTMGVVFQINEEGNHGTIVSLSQTKCNWNDAMAWCVSLGNNWRMPSIKELVKICRFNKAASDFNRAINNEAELFGWYWSLNECDLENAWGMGLNRGSVTSANKSHEAYVRAVCYF